MGDDFREEIGKLHQHIEHVSNQVRDVQRGQDDLHKEHSALRERVDHLERTVSKDTSDLAAHINEANIYRGHLIEGFGSLQRAVENLDNRFGKHAEAEEKDRKDVIKALQGENFQTRRNAKTDFLWAVGIAVTVGLSLFGLLAATGTVG